MTWKSDIHSQPVYTGRIEDLRADKKNALEHIHSRTVSDLLAKTSAQASHERFFEKQKKLDPQGIYRRINNEFLWRFYEHEGYKDGMHGLITDKFMEMYRILEFAFYWEKKKYPEIFTQQELKEMWNLPMLTHDYQQELAHIKDSKWYRTWIWYEMVKQKIRSIQKSRTLMKISSYKNIGGWLSPNEALGLYETVRKLDNKDSIIVEIGSWKGKSTYCLAKGLRSGRIFAIDPFDASGEEGSASEYKKLKGDEPLLDQFKRTMTRLGVMSKITPLVGYSSAFTNFDKPIDFLFIDGDHSQKGCLYDFEHFSPKIKKGGYIAFHDYRPERKDLGPTWVIDNVVIPSGAYREIARYDALWVGQKYGK